MVKGEEVKYKYDKLFPISSNFKIKCCVCDTEKSEHIKLDVKIMMTYPNLFSSKNKYGICEKCIEKLEIEDPDWALGLESVHS